MQVLDACPLHRSHTRDLNSGVLITITSHTRQNQPTWTQTLLTRVLISHLTNRAIHLDPGRCSVLPIVFRSHNAWECKRHRLDSRHRATELFLLKLDVAIAKPFVCLPCWVSWIKHLNLENRGAGSQSSRTKMQPGGLRGLRFQMFLQYM